MIELRGASHDAWLPALDEPTGAAVERMVSAAHHFDGVAPLSEQSMINLRSADAAEHAVVWDRGRVVGYANVTPAAVGNPPSAEVVVSPDARRHGIATRLLERINGRRPDATIWAHGNLPSARAFAARFDLVPTRELLRMAMRLAGRSLPSVTPPIGIVTRTYAGPDDDEDLVRVNAAAFDWHPEQGAWTARDIADRREAGWFSADGLFLCFEGENLVGFHWTKREADEPRIGEVYVLAVAPAAHGRGIGTWLTVCGLRYLAEQGVELVRLYTEADNRVAVHTYTKLGFAPDVSDVTYRFA